MFASSRSRIGVLVILLGLATGFLVAPSDKTVPKTPAALGAELIADIAYGDDSRQRYDVYLPDNGDEPLPAVVYIHGGGWTAGDKSQSMPIWEWTDDGYAVVSINYRYAIAPNSVAASTADAIAAVGQLIATADEHGIDPDRIGVYGFSAGGHLAAMVAQADLGVAAVAVSGSPTDFEVLTDPQRSVFEIRSSEDAAATVRDRLGCARTSCAEAIATLSPARLPAGPAPILVLHGERDAIISPTQAELLANHLDREGATVELRIVPDKGHSPPLDESLLQSFFGKHLAP